jgi:two-component system, OmpR family, sensor histidine kinase ArlS
MNKISIKIGLLFFIATFFLETILVAFLHQSIIESRVDDELSSLLTRGNNHREILEESFYPETVKHIALMESKTDTQVIITNNKEKIISSSNVVTQIMKDIILDTPNEVPYEGMILEKDWRDQPFIVSISTIKIGDKVYGYVYMFKSTQEVKELISGLNKHFFIAGILSVIVLLIIISILTRLITSPLITMSLATKRLRQGDFSVTFPKMGDDELGELAESIKILAIDLNRLKNERNEFLASISHELRTPLTYIKGYAEIAQRENLQKNEQHKYLNIISEESSKLSNLIKELFELAKMDENTFSIKKKQVNLTSFFENVLEKISPAFINENKKLTLNCQGNIDTQIDPVRFEQVIVNLLENARKYSEPHSTTQIEVHENQDKIHILIKDHGTGIPGRDLSRVFERFYRVDKSRTRASGGYGLGLSIAKEIIEAHNGSINIKSSLDKGTTVEIIL